MLSLLVAMVVRGIILVGAVFATWCAPVGSAVTGDQQAQPLFDDSDPWHRLQLGLGQVAMPVGDKEPVTTMEGPVGAHVEVNRWLGTDGHGISTQVLTTRAPCPVPRLLAESALRRAFRPALESDGWRVTWEDGVNVDGVPGWGVVAVKADDVPTGVLYGRYLVVRHRIAAISVAGPQSEDDTVRSTFERMTDSFSRTNRAEPPAPTCAAV